MELLFKGVVPPGVREVLKAPREAFAKALEKETFRQLLARVAKGNLSEVGEEGMQELGSQVLGYLARSYEAGELQQPDMRGAGAEVGGAMGQAAGGVLLPAVTSVAVNVATAHVAQRHQEARQTRSDNTVAAIAEAATTPTAQASPTAVASLVADETGVETVQVAPGALVRYFQTQANPEAAATAMLGEGAQETLQKALATGDRVDVSVASVLALGEGAKALVPEMATAPDVDTKREALERHAARQAAETEAQARSLVEAHAAPEAALSETEKRLDALQDSLADTQHYTAAEARQALETWRALTRTMAARMGKSMDELFSGALFAVEDDNGTPTLVLQPSVTARYTKEGATVTTAGTGAVEQLGEVVIEAKEGARTYRIRLRPGANRSTFLHETGHVALELMGDMAEREDAPAKLKEDYAALLRGLGVASRAELEGKHHEAFAEMSEAYFRDGIAPSEALAPAFARYREWLHKVYPALPAVHAQLSPEVREVMDRLFATDEEISAARTAAGYTPTVRTAESVHMTPEEFAALQGSFAQSEEAARRALETQVREAQAQEADERWQKEEATEKEDAGHEYDARPDVRAHLYLAEGKWVLLDEDGKTQVVEAVGTVGLARKAVLRMLGVKQVPAALRRLVRTKADSKTRTEVHPDAVAEMFGFPTGAAMLKALQALPRREAFVGETAARRMAEKHPTLANDRVALREAAQTALHAEGTTQPLLREWEAMRRVLPEGALKALPLAAVRRAATLMAERTRVRALDARRALAAEKRASEAAAAAWARGDVVAANQAKLQQVLNHLLFRELKAAEKEKASFQKALSSATKDATLRMLGQGGVHFRRLVEALTGALEGLGTETPSEQQRNRNVRLAALKAFQDALEKNPTLKGLAPAFDEGTVSALLSNPTPWQSLTLSEMREASKLLAQVQKLAEDSSRVALEGKAMSVTAVADGMATDVAGKRAALQIPAEKAQRVWWQHLSYYTDAFFQGMGDVEEQLKHLGPTAHAFFIRGFLEARKVKQELAREVGAFFAEKWDKLPKELAASRYELVDTSALPMPAALKREGPMTRQAVWMIALNYGNEATRQHLLQGYGWTEKQVQDFLAATLTKEEWDFVQGVWDLMDKKLQPRLSAHYESINGVPLKAPKATPIETPHGVYRGGFFPMTDDPNPLAAAHAEALSREVEGNTAAQVVRSFNKPLGKGTVRLVNLDWGVVPAHVGQTIHYLAMDSFVRDARRVLAHPTAVRAIVQRRGEAGLSALTSFVNAVENDQPDNNLTGLAKLSMKLFDTLKGTLPYISLAFNVGNAAGDLLNPVVAVIKGEVSARWAATVYMKALVGVLAPSMWKGRAVREAMWKDMRGKALEKSTELRQRHESQTDKLRKQLAEVGAEGKRSTAGRYLHAAKESAFILQACTDALTSTVVWEARYQQALAQGLSEEAAVQAADDVLRADFPTGEMALQPIFLREKAATGNLVVMMGYIVKLGNIKASLLRGPLEAIAEAEGWEEHLRAMTPLAKAGAQVMLLTLVGNVLPDILSGRGWEEDEPWEEWVLRKLATANASHIPFVGFGAEHLLELAVLKATGSKKEAEPMSARAGPAASAALRIFKSVGEAVDADTPDAERLVALLNLVNAQAAKAGGYVAKAAKGEAEVGAFDVAQGLLYGPPKKKERASPVTILRDLVK